MKINKEFDIKIVELPEKVLRKMSSDIDLPLSQEDIELAEKMIYHIDDSQKENSKFRARSRSCCCSIRDFKKVFYVFLQDDKNNVIFKDVLFNPNVVIKSDKLVALSEGEGCLSVYQKTYQIKKVMFIEVKE
ncbi:peptide deformylase [Mycoplasmopsis felis]|uniref:peptide deformylase n=1 Tax=Mycoplasmopsis felis TaxID=33923 RepID=UPI0021E02642|nr:peptide deformylase [Mycoplasmopsis felis]MCU9934014.1 peptide deformylase [Mycoplasmopsis felis]